MDCVCDGASGEKIRKISTLSAAKAKTSGIYIAVLGAGGEYTGAVVEGEQSPQAVETALADMMTTEAAMAVVSGGLVKMEEGKLTGAAGTDKLVFDNMFGMMAGMDELKAKALFVFRTDHWCRVDLETFDVVRISLYKEAPRPVDPNAKPPKKIVQTSAESLAGRFMEAFDEERKIEGYYPGKSGRQNIVDDLMGLLKLPVKDVRRVCSKWLNMFVYHGSPFVAALKSLDAEPGAVSVVNKLGQTLGEELDKKRGVRISRLAPAVEAYIARMTDQELAAAYKFMLSLASYGYEPDFAKSQEE